MIKPKACLCVNLGVPDIGAEPLRLCAGASGRVFPLTQGTCPKVTWIPGSWVAVDRLVFVCVGLLEYSCVCGLQA